MLSLAHISKTFGETRAVDDVSFNVRAAEIVALVGENGAGKTTLMRIAARELAPDAGSVEVDGHLELVHQHFMLVPALTVAENLALPRPGFRFTRRATLVREAEELIAASGIEFRDVTRLVAELSVGEKSKLELIKAIARKPSVLVLDEPTSVLTPTEARELFAVMRRLAAGGTAVVFISHKLPEVMEIAERIVVLRGGRVVTETRTSDTSAAELARAMVQTAAPVSTTRYRNIRAIVGVAGNGQTELAERFLREYPKDAHIPEDRTRDGVIAEMTIAENLALRRRTDAHRAIDRFAIRASGPRQRAGDLSGGNQQKVILARELDAQPHRIFAAEPTRGLDIESTRFVHDQLREAAERGAEITLITSDLDEAFALSDHIQVIYRGRLSEPMTAGEAASKVAALMGGAT